MKGTNLASITTHSERKSDLKSVTIESLGGLFFLVRESNRYDKPTLFIRLRLGNMAPRRYGPFTSLKKAKTCLRAMAAHLGDTLADEFNELGGVGAEYGSTSSGLYNIEE